MLPHSSQQFQIINPILQKKKGLSRLRFEFDPFCDFGTLSIRQGEFF